MVRVRRMVLALLGCATLVANTGSARAGTYREVYAFQGGSDGAYPGGLLVIGTTLFGVTSSGGGSRHCSGGCGTVFALDLATDTERVVYSFKDGPDGASPSGRLIHSGDILYGVTAGDLRLNKGTAFALNRKTHIETTLHTFGGVGDGAYPYASMINVGGQLYGTTDAGGSSDYGTVFTLDPTTGIERIVLSFKDNPKSADGGWPDPELLDFGGKLYGSTTVDHVSDPGLIFALDPTTGAETVLHIFRGVSDGAGPHRLYPVAGTLYGTTSTGGISNMGTVFSLNPITGAERVVYSFQGGLDGFLPVGGLIRFGGALFGATAFGGGNKQCYQGCGTLFSVSLATGSETVLRSFRGGSDGGDPSGDLVKIGKTLYGTTVSGGGAANCWRGCGTVFAFTP